MNPSRIVASITKNLENELLRLNDVFQEFKTDDVECESDDCGDIEDAMGYLMDAIHECKNYLINNPIEEDVNY